MKHPEKPPNPADDAESFRRVALMGVCMATTSTILIMISIPMTYSYVQQRQSFMSDELNFCRSRGQSILLETAKTTVLQEVKMKLMGMNSEASLQRDTRDVEKVVKKFNVQYKDRLRRQNEQNDRINRDLRRQVSNAFQAYSVDQPKSGCCGCGHSLPGPPGRKGHPGWPGVAGQPGRAGNPGPEGAPRPQQDIIIDWCYECANSEPGPQGRQGPPGPQGQQGYQGFDSLLHAEPGLPGPPGLPGLAGGKGPCGATGSPGLPGKLFVVEKVGPPGPPGQQGARGYPGRPGTPGIAGEEPRRGPPGDPGQPGRPGTPGFPGQRGYQGDVGPRGSCAHCPPPRTAPGY